MAIVYASKNNRSEIVTNPEHGRSGWRLLDNGSLEEVVFITAENGWINVEQYRLRIAERKYRNIEFFRNHPDQLRRKIELSRARQLRKLRLGTGTHLAWAS